MAAVDRPFRTEPDYARLRALLLEGARRGLALVNWPPARLDGLRYGVHWQAELRGERSWEEDFRVWEAAPAGTLLGVAHFEGPRQGALQVHPDARALEGDMLAWLEARHRQKRPPDATEWTLEIPALTTDRRRQRLLAERGFVRCRPVYVTRVRDMAAALPQAPVAPGFTVRLIEQARAADLEQVAASTRLIFPHADTEAATLRLFAHAPTWSTHWVAEAPDGRFAALAGIWYEPALRHGQFEPVGTLADFRRRGLARAVMAAGLRHLAALGAEQVIVDTGYDNVEANPLYAALGFSRVEVYDVWEKQFGPAPAGAPAPAV